MKRARVIAVLVLVAVLVTTLLYSQQRPRLKRVSGFIEAHDVRVGSRIGGRVEKVLVEEGHLVRRGEPLVVLEAFDLLQRQAQAAAEARQKQELLAQLQAGFRREEITAAQAAVERWRAEVEKLVAGPRQKEIDAATARHGLTVVEMEQAELQFQRVQALLTSGASTRESFDEADKQLKVARQRTQVTADELALLKEGTRPEDIAAAKASLAQAMAEFELRRNGNRPEEIAAAKAEHEAALATLAAIERQVAELTIIAPVDGMVEATDLRPGDLINPNAPAISLIDNAEIWVRAYVPENQLDLKIGEELRVTVDSFPDRSFQGRLAFVARNAEFTPGNVQTPEERSKQVFRIKVVLTSGLDVLRPGMSADVWLDGKGQP